ncbi:hypothetical protein SAMN04488505_10720 [Chitinophaga rupis]|uniref:Uncharacterized protein n=1 Tax=Chitinophaga rupis TaxID=573321 RepID=A0A1H8C7H5_9BACT|nr:hypothetical protein [Chitinophaga rupis]SEM91005.1 hypothetical protein SAMN04488505_10720 [Chitinophaga rupis]
MKRMRLINTIILLLVASHSMSQNPVTVGIGLTQLSDQLQKAIENAKNAGLNLEIEAGREVALSIENFKNAYASSLNLTFDKLDHTATKQFESLKSLTNQIKDQTVTSLLDVTASAQQIIDALPFRSHQPHLRSFTPSYIVPTNHNYDVTIICKGNFEAAGSKDYQPTLKVGKHVYTSGGGNQGLEFHVPISTFMELNGIEKNKFGYIKCELNVPWRDKMYFIFPSKKVDTYNLYVGTLPKQPGEIVLIRTINTPMQKDSTITNNPPFRQSSCSDGGNNDKPDVPWVIHPTPGWTVIPGSSSIRAVDGSQGDYGFRFISDAGNMVQYNVSTFHHGITGGPSGCVNFTITLKESMNYTQQTFQQIPYDINWGDSRTIDFSEGEWKITFKAFDGSVNELAGVDNTNPFIQIIKTGMTYKIVTTNPSVLTWH